MNSCRSQDLPGKSSIGALLNLELDRTESGRPLTGVSGSGSDWAQLTCQSNLLQSQVDPLQYTI